MVELLEEAAEREFLDHVAGRRQQVVARGALLDLGAHRLVRVEDVDFHAAVVFLLEPFDEIRIDVFGPREDVEGFLLGSAARGEEGGGGDGENTFLHVLVVSCRCLEGVGAPLFSVDGGGGPATAGVALRERRRI